MRRITRHSAAAALEMLPGGVLAVRLSGPLTGEALLEIKAAIVATYSGTPIRSFVADYSGAIVAMSGAELDAVLEGEGPGSVPALPAALVVRPECADLFAGHALRMAGRGIMRRVFSSQSSALEWAQREAARVRR